MNELITIVINVYNREKYIKKCLDSIVNQTYKNLEILIVDDGSTDNTVKICKSYKDKRIRIISGKNTGISLARNVGIDNAKGNYLYYVDSDDFIELDTIEYLYKLIKKYNVDIATCVSKHIHNYNIKKEIREEKEKIISSREMLVKILIDTDDAVDIWNKLYKKEIFGNLRFKNRIISDMDFMPKLIMRTNKIVYGNQLKYYCLKHKNSITGIKTRGDRMIDMYKVILERYYNVKKVYPNLIENNIGVLKKMIWLDLKNNEEYENFISEQERRKNYNEIFTFKIIFCSKINFREKIKIILFRINPKLNKKIINTYLKIKKRKKK